MDTPNNGKQPPTPKQQVQRIVNEGLAKAQIPTKEEQNVKIIESLPKIPSCATPKGTKK